MPKPKSKSTAVAPKTKPPAAKPKPLAASINKKAKPKSKTTKKMSAGISRSRAKPERFFDDDSDMSEPEIPSKKRGKNQEPGLLETFLDNLSSSIALYGGQSGGDGGPSYEKFVQFCSHCLKIGKFDADEFSRTGLDAWSLQQAYSYLSTTDFGRRILASLGVPVLPTGMQGRMPPPPGMMMRPPGMPPPPGMMPAGAPRPPMYNPPPRPGPTPTQKPNLSLDQEMENFADAAYQQAQQPEQKGGLFSFLWD